MPIQKRFTAYKIPIGLISQGRLQLEKDEEGKERFRYINLGNRDVSRVNIISNVIDKFISENRNYGSLTIDDGTGNIRIKVFSDSLYLIEEIQLGDTILVIGLLRYFNNELYILPEVLKTSDARWLLVRKLELKKDFENLGVGISKTQTPAQSLNPPSQTSQAYQSPQSAQTTSSPGSSVEPVEVEKIEDTVSPGGGNEVKDNKIEDVNEDNLTKEILDYIKNTNEEGADTEQLILTLKQPVEKINSTIAKLLEENKIYESRPGRLRLL